MNNRFITKNITKDMALQFLKDAETSEQKIKIAKEIIFDRFFYWYIEPIKNINEHGGFILLNSCLRLLDYISQIRMGHERNGYYGEYKSWRIEELFKEIINDEILMNTIYGALDDIQKFGVSRHSITSAHATKIIDNKINNINHYKLIVINPWELFNKIEEILKHTINTLSNSRVIAYVEWAIFGFLGADFWEISESEYQMWWKMNINYEGAIEE